MDAAAVGLGFEIGHKPDGTTEERDFTLPPGVVAFAP